jgi:hypothetical protein
MFRYIKETDMYEGRMSDNGYSECDFWEHFNCFCKYLIDRTFDITYKYAYDECLRDKDPDIESSFKIFDDWRYSDKTIKIGNFLNFIKSELPGFYEKALTIYLKNGDIEELKEIATEYNLRKDDLLEHRIAKAEIAKNESIAKVKLADELKTENKKLRSSLSYLQELYDDELKKEQENAKCYLDKEHKYEEARKKFKKQDDFLKFIKDKIPGAYKKLKQEYEKECTDND